MHSFQRALSRALIPFTHRNIVIVYRCQQLAHGHVGTVTIEALLPSADEISQLHSLSSPSPVAAPLHAVEYECEVELWLCGSTTQNASEDRTRAQTVKTAPIRDPNSNRPAAARQYQLEMDRKHRVLHRQRVKINDPVTRIHFPLLPSPSPSESRAAGPSHPPSLSSNEPSFSSPSSPSPPPSLSSSPPSPKPTPVAAFGPQHSTVKDIAHHRNATAIPAMLESNAPDPPILASHFPVLAAAPPLISSFQSLPFPMQLPDTPSVNHSTPGDPPQLEVALAALAVMLLFVAAFDLSCRFVRCFLAFASSPSLRRSGHRRRCRRLNPLVQCSSSSGGVGINVAAPVHNEPSPAGEAKPCSNVVETAALAATAAVVVAVAATQPAVVTCTHADEAEAATNQQGRTATHLYGKTGVASLTLDREGVSVRGPTRKGPRDADANSDLGSQTCNNLFHLPPAQRSTSPSSSINAYRSRLSAGSSATAALAATDSAHATLQGDSQTASSREWTAAARILVRAHAHRTGSIHLGITRDRNDLKDLCTSPGALQSRLAADAYTVGGTHARDGDTHRHTITPTHATHTPTLPQTTTTTQQWEARLTPLARCREKPAAMKAAWQLPHAQWQQALPHLNPGRTRIPQHRQQQQHQQRQVDTQPRTRIAQLVASSPSSSACVRRVHRLWCGWWATVFVVGDKSTAAKVQLHTSFACGQVLSFAAIYKI